MGKQTGQGKALRTWHKYRLFRPSVPLYGALPVPAKQLRTFAPRKPHSRRLHQGCLTTHTPQGDGNPHWCDSVHFFVITTHTPQGDGNAKLSPATTSPCTLQPTPRKGTETAAARPSRGRKRLQPTPRKGTETEPGSKCLQQEEITTHTPQGDGNHNRYLFLCFFCNYNPHPARGRKPSLV